MAQLKDTIVNGGLRATESVASPTGQFDTIYAKEEVSTGITENYTSGGDKQILQSGTFDDKKITYWASLSPKIQIIQGTGTEGPTIGVTVAGVTSNLNYDENNNPIAITKATTNIYGVTKLTNLYNASTPDGVLAATGVAIKAAIDTLNSNIPDSSNLNLDIAGANKTLTALSIQSGKIDAATFTDIAIDSSQITSGINRNTILYGDSTGVIQSMAPAWDNWGNGTTAGPQAKIQIGAITYTSPAIPAASTIISGIVTTGNQNFTGIKNFVDRYISISPDDNGEGGEIRLNAASLNTTQAGIVLDQYNSTFRIFGIASADGETIMDEGTPLVIDPYNKTIAGGYTLTGHASLDLPLTGGTLTGNLTISHATNATMTADSTNPQITFAENGSQPVHLIYSDYDSYRAPAGLKIIGGADATPAWFEVEGQVYAEKFNNFKIYVGTGVNADDVRTTNGLWISAAAITNAAITNHGALIGLADVGTPSQFYIPDSSTLYIYKRWYSSSAWSGWSKISAGYADSAGSVAWTNITSNPGIYTNDVTTYGNIKLTAVKGSYYGINFGTTKSHMTVMSSGQHNGMYCEAKGRWIFYYDSTNDRCGIGTSSLASGYMLTVSGLIRANGLHTTGGDLSLGTSSSSSDDSGDIAWFYGNGKEKMRIWTDNEYASALGPLYRVYKSDGTNLYNGRLVTAGGHGASGTWGINITGSAGSVAWGNVSGRPTIDKTTVVYQIGRGADVDPIQSGYFACMTTKSGITSDWWHLLSMDWTGNDANNWISQLAIPTQGRNGLYYRSRQSGSTGAWIKCLDTGNYTSYTVTKTGSGASGTWSINVAGDITTSSIVLTNNEYIAKSSILHIGTSSDNGASNPFIYTGLSIRDSNDYQVGECKVHALYNGDTQIHLTVRNKTTANVEKYNIFEVGVRKNGTLYYTVSSQEAFRTAIGASASSDKRLKIECGTIPNVSSIEAHHFKWNDNKDNHDNFEHIGYFAQDIEKIAPYLVHDDENGYKTLDYISFLCAKITCLENRIKQLEMKTKEEL